MATSEITEGTDHRPLSRDELFARFDSAHSTSKHLLILYSLVMGLNAKVVVDLGLGQTTAALRSAAVQTGATVYSCDFDKRSFEHMLPEQDEHWRLYLEPSASFLEKVPEPIDFVMHDGAHDYVNVKRDLQTILPKMRKFGIICVHDTQQPELYRDMLAAIRDATEGFAVSITNLPFSAGLAIIRVESSRHPAIVPWSGTLPDGRLETDLIEFATVPSSQAIQVSASRAHLIAAKIKFGHILRQAGLRR